MAENGKDTGKKRKRNTEDSNKPSKKVAIQAPSPVKKVNISVVPGTQEWAPIVGMPQIRFQAHTPLDLHIPIMLFLI
jgi:hypothetical protein